MTDDSPERPRWWRSRRLRLFLVLGVIVTLVAWVALDVWAGRRVDATFARLEERYGSLDGRSMVAPAVPAEDNQARFVKAAVALTVRGDRSLGALTASLTQAAKNPSSSDASADVRAFIDRNREAIRIAGEARSRRRSSWGADYGGGANTPRWLDLRTLSTAIYLSALLDIGDARPDAASEKIASGLAVSSSIRQEPSLIGQLIRIAIATEQCEAVKRLLVAGAEPSPASLEELARSLAENRRPAPMDVGLLAEMRYGNRMLSELEHGRRTDEELSSSSMWVRPLARTARPFVRLARADYLQQMERLIEIERGPRPRPPIRESTRPARWHWRRLATTFTQGLERAIDSGDTFSSVLGVAELGVALRRYRLDRAVYPDDLAALVPTYLPRLPVDARTGRPPAYARRGAGFTVKAEAVGRSAIADAALDWTVAR